MVPPSSILDLSPRPWRVRKFRAMDSMVEGDHAPQAGRTARPRPPRDRPGRRPTKKRAQLLLKARCGRLKKSKPLAPLRLGPVNGRRRGVSIPQVEYQAKRVRKYPCVPGRKAGRSRHGPSEPRRQIQTWHKQRPLARDPPAASAPPGETLCQARSYRRRHHRRDDPRNPKRTGRDRANGRGVHSIHNQECGRRRERRGRGTDRRGEKCRSSWTVVDETKFAGAESRRASRIEPSDAAPTIPDASQIGVEASGRGRTKAQPRPTGKFIFQSAFRDQGKAVDATFQTTQEDSPPEGRRHRAENFRQGKRPDTARRRNARVHSVHGAAQRARRDLPVLRNLKRARYDTCTDFRIHHRRDRVDGRGRGGDFPLPADQGVHHRRVMTS